jgi:hypothetical protein
LIKVKTQFSSDTELDAKCAVENARERIRSNAAANDWTGFSTKTCPFEVGLIVGMFWSDHNDYEGHVRIANPNRLATMPCLNPGLEERHLPFTDLLR